MGTETVYKPLTLAEGYQPPTQNTTDFINSSTGATKTYDYNITPVLIQAYQGKTTFGGFDHDPIVPISITSPTITRDIIVNSLNYSYQSHEAVPPSSGTSIIDNWRLIFYLNNIAIYEVTLNPDGATTQSGTDIIPISQFVLKSGSNISVVMTADSLNGHNVNMSVLFGFNLSGAYI